MLNNFIYAETKQMFESELLAGNIRDEAIVFIADTGEIWNHGTYFAEDCGYDPDAFAALQIMIDSVNTNKQDTINDLDSIRAGAAKGATAIQQIDYDQVIDNLADSGFMRTTDGMIHRDDCDTDITASLNKADSALQSYTEQYTGTITKVQANGTDVASSGTANIPAASTSKYGVTKLSSATNSTSTSLAATASAVKAAYDLANGKQAALVSGTNIKTINSQSLLGSGNITVGGEDNVQSDWNVTDSTSDAYIKNKPTIPSAVTESTISGWGFTKNGGTYSKPSGGIPSSDLTSAIQTSLGKADTAIQSIKTINGTSLVGSGDLTVGNKTLTTTTATSIALSPGVYYRKTNQSTSLTITLSSESNTTILNEYFIEFTTSSSGTTVTLPSTVKWVNGIKPTFEKSSTYQISIINGLGVCSKFA